MGLGERLSALQTFLDAILGGSNTTMAKHKGTRIKVKDMTPSSMLAGATHYLHLLLMVYYPAAEHFAMEAMQAMKATQEKQCRLVIGI